MFRLCEFAFIYKWQQCAGSSNASVAMDLPPDVVSKAWADIGRPSEVAKQRLAVRALSAAARYAS